jgi:prevent-host-death family protein
MELALRDAKARLSELVTAAQRGERVVITKYGEPAVELVRCRKRRGGIDFDKLEADCRRLGIREASPDEAEAMIAAFHDSALSRRLLGIDDE